MTVNGVACTIWTERRRKVQPLWNRAVWSNYRPGGRMWPADRIVRARELCSIDCSNKRKNFYNVRL